MFKWLKDLFSEDDEETLSDKLSLLAVGDLVRLKFIDPTKMGFLNAGQATVRFDSDDLVERRLRGIVTNLSENSEFRFIELVTFKKYGDRVVMKKYILLENELESLDIFDGELWQKDE